MARATRACKGRRRGGRVYGTCHAAGRPVVKPVEHRHYSASFIAFEDLVGFPYPDAKRRGVKFLDTPTTVWGAHSVLIDEISRCKHNGSH
jgi:hypothetical protein